MLGNKYIYTYDDQIEILPKTEALVQPPGSGSLPQLVECPPYFRYDSLGWTPPSQPPGDLTDDRFWGGTGRGTGYTYPFVNDSWKYMPAPSPPHPKDIWDFPNDKQLGWPAPETPPLVPNPGMYDPDVPLGKWNPDDWNEPTGKDSYINPDDGKFNEELYNEDYEFWQELWNPNNPQYQEFPGMLPTGWPGFGWDVEDIIVPGAFPWWEPRLTSPPFDGYTEEQRKFRERFVEFLRRTGQGKRRPVRKGEEVLVPPGTYPGQPAGSLGTVHYVGEALKKFRWVYYGCIYNNCSGTAGRHPDAPPTQLDQYPWWGLPWGQLPDEAKEIFSDTDRQIYEYCNSAHCQDVNPSGEAFPNQFPGLWNPVWDIVTCGMCEILRKRKVHPLVPPGAPYWVPPGGTSVPEEYLPGTNGIPKDADPRMIPDPTKWKYFDNCRGWWQLEPPEECPSPWDYPRGPKDANGEWKFNPDGTPNNEWIPPSLPAYDPNENPFNGPRRLRDRELSIPHPGNPVPGYPVPCGSDEWRIPISTTSQGITSPSTNSTDNSNYEMFEPFGPLGPFNFTDSVYSSSKIIPVVIKQKSVFSFPVPTVIGNIENLSKLSSIALIDKNVKRFNAKMNKYYKWVNRFKIS